MISIRFCNTRGVTNFQFEFLRIFCDLYHHHHHHHHHHHNHHYHHHVYVMELGHLLTRSGLTYPEVSSKVCHDSFCQLRNSVSLPWVIYCEAFYLHVVYIYFCIPVICPKLVLFSTSFQFVYLFCNLTYIVIVSYIWDNIFIYI